MSDLINQTLPEAVRKHLQVMEIELTGSVRVHSALSTGRHGQRWYQFKMPCRLSPRYIDYLNRRKVTKVVLAIGPSAMLSEFDIEEMVW